MTQASPCLSLAESMTPVQLYILIKKKIKTLLNEKYLLDSQFIFFENFKSLWLICGWVEYQFDTLKIN